jgi:FtsZ-binding cell division protein ZapB
MSDIVERLREAKYADMNPQDPRKLCAQAADTITALRAEVERFKTAGICEVAASNPSVMDWMRHWEDRALKAEAEVDAIRKLLPGWCVFDPPDGGDVKTVEAVQRLLVEGERLRLGRDACEDQFQARVREIGDLLNENERLRAALDLYREAVRIDATMEGPKFMGSNASALKRAWEADLAALEEKT